MALCNIFWWLKKPRSSAPMPDLPLQIVDAAVLPPSIADDPPPPKETRNDFEIALGRLASTSWNGFKVLIKVLHEASGAFPPLDATVGGLVALLDIYDRTKDNYGWMNETMQRIDRLLVILAKRLEGEKDSTSSPVTEGYVATLQEEFVKIQGLSARSGFSRAVASEDDAAELKRCCDAIANTMLELQLELGLSVERNTRVLIQEKVLQDLPRARAASFTAATSAGVSRRSCTAGTRIRILRDILDWVHDQDPESPAIFWLSGLAGQGKTTIAHTICERLEADTKTASVISFFCSRQLDTRGEAVLVSTLAFELAEASASFAVELVNALRQDHDLGQQRIEVQMKKLLVGPWAKSTSHRDDLPPILIIVDALDENDVGVRFAELLLSTLGACPLPGLRFVLTSRPEMAFEHAFARSTSVHVRRMDINSMVGTDDRTILDEDILHYLEEVLPRHCGTAHLEALAGVSSGLFVYAATAVAAIKPDPYDSQKTLQEEKEEIVLITGYGHAVASRGDRGAILDGLYEGIISKAFGRLSSEQKQRRMHVIFTCIVALRAGPISRTVLSELAGVGEELAGIVLGSLQAVLYTDQEQHLLCYHISFEEYVLGSFSDAFRKHSMFLLVQQCCNTIAPVHASLQLPTVLIVALKNLPECEVALPDAVFSVAEWLACRMYTLERRKEARLGVFLDVLRRGDIRQRCADYLEWWREQKQHDGTTRGEPPVGDTYSDPPVRIKPIPMELMQPSDPENLGTSRAVLVGSETDAGGAQGVNDAK
ncbi:unnamed protein product [Peniophora sp. CBMAI 1063]|nr:unnamed protein product [Peniophora sp. CBMAI 1063]